MRKVFLVFSFLLFISNELLSDETHPLFSDVASGDLAATCSPGHVVGMDDGQISVCASSGTAWVTKDPVDIVWTLSGTDVYYTGGNVGIGITNPTQNLVVYGSGSTVAKIQSTDDIAQVAIVPYTGKSAILNMQSDSYNSVSAANIHLDLSAAAGYHVRQRVGGTLVTETTNDGTFRIVPLATAPATCTQGELYFDTTQYLCMCTATNTWVEVQDASTTCT